MTIESYPDMGIYLEEERLSDGSKVYNILIKDGKLDCISKADAYSLINEIREHAV